MLAAFWQGELMAALDAVEEDVDLRLQVTRNKPAEIPSLKIRHGLEEIAVFFKELLEKVP